MATKNDFKIELDVFLKNDLDKVNIIKKIKEEFTSKGLNWEVPNLLFDVNSGLSVDDLDLLELIAISKVLFKLGYSAFDTSKYFTSGERDSYETYVYLPEQNNDILIFNDVTMYNEQLYMCTKWKPSQQAKARRDRLIRYNFLTQREAIYKSDCKGNVRKIINLDRNSVEGIKETMRKGEYFPPDTISLNIPILEGRSPRFDYNEQTRQLKIYPNYDIDSEFYCPVDITDGWHRDTATSELEDELRQKGININDIFEGFPVQISFMTLEQAASYVRRQNLARKQSVEHSETMINDGINKFIKKLNTINNEENNILYNNIAKTYEEMKIKNKKTNEGILRKTLLIVEKEEGINYDNFVEQVTNSKKYINVINELDRELKDLSNRNYDTMYNIYIGYLALCVYIVKNRLSDEKMMETINSFAMKITNMDDEEFDDLKLSNKNIRVAKAYSYFKSLIQK